MGSAQCVGEQPTERNGRFSKLGQVEVVSQVCSIDVRILADLGCVQILGWMFGCANRKAGHVFLLCMAGILSSFQGHSDTSQIPAESSLITASHGIGIIGDWN